jgi:DNA modification methylase
MPPASLIKNDLNFHDQASTYASHGIHAFAAKFPPQVPKTFISELSSPGETVLDPMNGSGTTTLESYLLNRQGMGFDIDPMAVKIARVKVTPLEIDGIKLANEVAGYALVLLKNHAENVKEALSQRFDPPTREFIEYWFAPQTQLELMALILAIERVESGTPLRDFLDVIFSSIIVTKSGGVSRARDLAHSRPHLDKTKIPKNAIDVFSWRLKKFAALVSALPRQEPKPIISRGDARHLPLPDNAVHLVVTSPPYANAIDYMRAHKFSLVWFGRPINELSVLRRQYLGSEATNGLKKTVFPPFTEEILTALGKVDSKKEKVLRKYYSEMQQVMHEMQRVLLPGRHAVIVVGSSTMRGMDVKTPYCLADIAENELGFRLNGIASRELDRDRRMMPVSGRNNHKTGIEQRMHTEEVIVLQKP